MPKFELPTSGIVLVVAGTADQFYNWCRARGISAHDPRVIYCSTPERARGLSRRTPVVLTGTWRERTDLDLYMLEARFVNRQEDQI